MIDFIIIAIVLGIVAAIIGYIIKAKKNGNKCIGCPESKFCGGSCANCQCGCENKKI